MQAVSTSDAHESTWERRPGWGISTVAGVAAVILRPLVACAFALAVRAIVVPAPVTDAGSLTVFGSWPSGGVWVVLGVLFGFCVWLVDAAVRQRVFGTIADADISLGSCVVSALIMPGTWIFGGDTNLLVFCLVAGPVFLRWRSAAPGVTIWRGGTRAGLVRWRILQLSGAVVVGMFAVVLVSRAPVLAVSAYDESFSGGLLGALPPSETHAEGVNPLSFYTGKKTPRVLTYQLPLQNTGSLPLTITGLSAHVSGHILRLRSVSVDSSHIGAGDQATVTVRMVLGTCASPRPGPSTSVISGVRVSYSLLGGLIGRHDVLKPTGEVQLLCPSSSTPPTGALVLNVG